jgi:hypothetical protein
MNLKKAMYDRIEKKCIKININGEQLYLKDSLGWHIIHSPVDLKSVEDNTDLNGNINWKKVKWDKVALIFGSKSNAIITAIIGFLVVLLGLGINDFITSFNNIASNEAVQQCVKNAGLTLSRI